MKFKVRDRFAVILLLTREVERRGRMVTETTEKRYESGDEVDLTFDQARDHCMRLEPLDAEASTFMDAQVYVAPPPVGTDVQALVAKLVAEQLAAAGVGAKGAKA